MISSTHSLHFGYFDIFSDMRDIETLNCKPTCAWRYTSTTEKNTVTPFSVNNQQLRKAAAHKGRTKSSAKTHRRRSLPELRRSSKPNLELHPKFLRVALLKVGKQQACRFRSAKREWPISSVT
ncbi:hypothetical protein CEXT_141781 [Caerostris extrusa]|uniref:Uncharacterized protein n=1 Tax=Caerostris extrusa TaxID=172846 RepID=A0AAV4XDB8_CAEEX|nr:hypothetical protein CEXT_141781 [Caerostris extrusa]